MKTFLTLIFLSAISAFSLANNNNAESNDTKETTENKTIETTKDIHAKRNVNDIIVSINDSIDGRTIVNISPEIMSVLNKQFSTAKIADGFRIQIYSSNKGPAARKEAFNIEKNIKKQDPNMNVYVSYESPFWKVRLGNCINREDAEVFRLYVIDKFPDFTPETYIVPSEIEAN